MSNENAKCLVEVQHLQEYFPIKTVYCFFPL